MSTTISKIRRKKEKEQDIYAKSTILDSSYLEYRLDNLRNTGKSFLAFQEECCRWLTEGRIRILVNDCTINEKSEVSMALPDSNDAGVLLVCPNYDRYEWREELNFWRPDLYVETIKDKKSFSIPIPGEVNIVSWDSLPETISQEIYDPFVMVLADVDLAKKVNSARARKISNLISLPEAIIATTIDCYLEKAKDIFGILSVTGAIEELEVVDFADFKDRYFDRENRKYLPNLYLREFLHSIVKKRSAGNVCKRYSPLRSEERFLSINYLGSKALNRKLSKIGGIEKAKKGFKDKKINKGVLSEVLELSSSLKWPILQEIINSYIIESEPLIVVTSCEPILESLRKNKRWAVITKDISSETRDLYLSRFKKGTLNYMVVSHSVMTGLDIESESPCITVLRVEPDLDSEVNRYIYKKLEKIASRRSKFLVKPVHLVDIKAHNNIDALFWDNLVDYGRDCE